MNMTLSLVAALLATSQPVPGRCIPDPPEVAAQGGGEAYILAAEMEWAASIEAGEAAFLQRITSSDFVAVFDGKVFSRAALIAEAKQRRPGAATDELTSLRVHLFGSTAVAEGAEIWSEDARRRRIVWSDLWVLCGGAWHLVASTAIGAPMD